MSSININKLDTEKVNESTMNIDSVSSLEFVKLFNDEDKKVARAVESELESIAKIIDMAEKVLKNEGRIVYLGAGNSGRIAAGDACECVPTFGVDADTVIYVLAGGNNSLISANEGAEDNYSQGAEDLKQVKLEKKDLVIGLSASGRTPYVKGGLNYAKEVECNTASISCSRDSEISDGVNISVEIIVGPEAITGSTRLKAGTAQKMVVNMISSGAMIKIGKVYKNYMVDVSVKNKKLYERGKKIIIECTGVKEEVAQEFLDKSRGKVKTAILMILKDKSFEESERLLSKEPHIKNLI